MRFLKQAFTVTLVGLYTIPQRLSSPVVAVVGIAGVVVVLVAVLSIARRIQGRDGQRGPSGSRDRHAQRRRQRNVERPRRAGRGRHQAGAGIKRDGSTPVASAEMFVVIDVNRRATNTDANVPLRGVDAHGAGRAVGGQDRRRPHVALRHQ